MWSAHYQEEGSDELCLHRKPHFLPGAQSALREMSPCRRSFQSISAVCLFPFLSQEPRKHPLLLTKELSSVFSSSTTSSYYWVLLCLGFFLVVVARSLQDLSSPTRIKPRVMPWTPWNSLLCFITSLFSFYLINMLYFLGSFFSL